MQQTARGIALENGRLRALLARHGVTQVEIGFYLSSSSSVDGGPESHLTDRLGGCSGVSNTSKPPPELPYHAIQGQGYRTPSYTTLEALPSISPSLSPSQSHFTGKNSHFERDSSADHESISRACRSDRSDTQEQPDQDAGQLSRGHRRDGDHISYISTSMSDQDAPLDMLPEVSDCYCPPESPVPEPNATPSLETSCETAAGILAGLRGHDDSAQVRAAMGCVGTSECLVRNTRLFQLMDETS